MYQGLRFGRDLSLWQNSLKLAANSEMSELPSVHQQGFKTFHAFPNFLTIKQ